MVTPSHSHDASIPTPRAVAERALVLDAVCQRGSLEYAAGDDPAGAEARRTALVAWLQQEGLWEVCSPRERPLLEAPIGSLNGRQRETAFWRYEALTVLVWALGLLEMLPPYDVQASADEVFQRLPEVGVAHQDFLAQAALRPQEEIRKEQERAKLWHWRARTQRLIAAGFEDPETNLTDVVREVAQTAHEQGLLPAPVGGDFPARGAPYRLLFAEDLAVLRTIAEQRHLALNWLCGSGPTWDETPIHTERDRTTGGA